MSKNLIVVTDLDGTLLDHHGYSHAAAAPALRELARRRIPLVLNSSKTAAELLALRRELGNREPFVVENGAGLYAPAAGEGAFDRVVLGRERAEILADLRALRAARGYRFTGFADMSAEELQRHTGLGAAEAADALRRDFTEPLLWQDSEEKLVAFEAALRTRGLSLVRGGRFLHVSAPVDKGMALPWLRRYYSRPGRRAELIALGDGDNDRAMLEAADWPVLVRSPVNPPPRVRHAHLLVTEEEGPAGWNRAVLALLEKFPGRDGTHFKE